MKRLVAGIVLPLILAGCGNATSEAEDTSPSFNSGLDTDSAFVAVVRDGTDIFDISPDADIIKLGRVICEVLDTGAGFFDVVSSMDSPSSTEAAYVVGAAIAAYCPEYQDVIPS